MKKLHLICNAHIDPVWQWTFDEGLFATFSTFKSACDLADEFDYVFCHNESCLYEAIEKYQPSLFKRIKALVKKGKWKITGGWYIQPDCLMPSGESIVRQIHVGQEYFKEKFNVKPKVATNYDSFGHSLGLVQIMAKFGYKGYIATRPHKWLMQYPDGKFFRWTSPDGSSVILANTAIYSSGLGHAEEKIREELKTAEDVDFVLWGVGNHGGGPSRKDLTDIKNLKIDDVEIIHSTPEGLINDNVKADGVISTSLVTCNAGCYSSMAKIKREHREAENLLYSTEKMLAVAMLSGYKTDLTEFYKAQKSLLLAEFHDILPGSCISDGEKEGLELLGHCKKVVKDYRNGAFAYLTAGEPVAKEGEYPILVFNPSPYSVTCPIGVEFMLANANFGLDERESIEVYYKDEKLPSQSVKEESTINLDWRKKVVFEGKLKPLGITRFSVFLKTVKGVEKFGSMPIKASVKAHLENTVLTAPVTLETYSDTADPWGMSIEEQRGMGKNGVPFKLMSAKESKAFICAEHDVPPEHVIENGDVYTSVEAFYTNGKSNGVIEYKKYKNQPYIDIKLTIEFAEKDKLIKLCIPAFKGTVIGDGPYITEEKPMDSEMSFQKWLGVKDENGKVFAVINDGVYSGSYKDGNLYLTLLRGAGYCFHPIGDRKLYPTDRYLPRIDSGRYVYNFRIMTGSVEEVSCMSEFFAQQPYALNVFPIGISGKVVSVHTDLLVNMPVMKQGKGGETIMRFFNPELKDKEFTLFVDKASIKVKMKKAEIVSVVYKKGKLKVITDTIPV